MFATDQESLAPALEFMVPDVVCSDLDGNGKSYDTQSIKLFVESSPPRYLKTGMRFGDGGPATFPEVGGDTDTHRTQARVGISTYI